MNQAIEKRKKTLTSPKETYSPVTVPPTMKMLHTEHLHDPEVKIALADLHSAYLAAVMRKKVAIQLPDRWRIGGKDAVHVVIMALYGGDDSGRCFYDLWVDFHKAMGFKSIVHDMAYLSYTDGRQLLLPQGRSTLA